MKKTVTIVLASFFTIILAACQLINPAAATQAPTATSQPTAQLNSSVTSAGDQQNRLVEIYKLVNPGTVAINAYTANGGSYGTGFVYDKQGHIITNYHVIEGSNDFEVDFPSGLKVKGTLIASDPDSDLAVLKVDVPAEKLSPLTLGDSDQVQVGETVAAIGNPFFLDSTMTVGIISAKGRVTESLHQAPSGGYFTEGDMLQTDAAINVGNSGGPLVNLNGEVIGINRSIISTTSSSTGSEPGNIGIGFAIPINIAKHVIPILISKGSYAYPYLGLTSQDSLTLKEMEALGIPSDTIGIYIVAVSTGGPAEKAGLQGGSTDSGISGFPAGGDIILAVDGRQTANMSDLLTYLISNKNPGDVITLKVLRSGQTTDIKLTLGVRP